jgi:hypothetical protein
MHGIALDWPQTFCTEARTMTEMKLPSQPDTTVCVRDCFGIDSDLRVPAFRERDDHVPETDRWNIVATLNYLPREDEIAIVQARVPSFATPEGRKWISAMVAVAADS